MYYVEEMIELLNLSDEQAEDLWSYAECLWEDEGLRYDAFETAVDSFIEDEFGIEIVR